MADEKKGLVMKRPYYFILFLIISCSSDVEVKIQTSDLGLNSTPLTIQGGLNGVEKVVTLEYTGVNSDKVTACEVSNLSNLTETTTCSCDTEGLCSVGVTPVSSFGGVATFEYKVIAGEVVSNKAKTNINVKLIEYFAGAISTDNFLGLDVHWNSRTVLLTSGSGTNCVHAVDITSLSAPNLYNTLGTATSPATSGKNCRAVKITEDGTKFVLPTHDKHTEVWTFGGDSKDPSGWSELFDLSTSTKQPKRLSQFVDNGATYDFVISALGGLLKASLDKSTNAISITNNGTAAYDMTHSLTYQDAVYVNEDLIVATEAGNGKGVKVFASDSSLIKIIDLNNGSDYMWSSAVSGDQTKIAVGGGRLALLSYDELQSDADKVQLEFEVDISRSMRHMTFFNYQSSSYLAAAISDGSVSVYNVDDISNPFLVKNHKISAFDGEAYDLKVIESDELIIVAGTKGKFAILSIPGFF
ncbi:MAG: hypothetical protein ACJAS4_003000 [Bacteriovoracaceae bacterium]|jgi:hypothetical protein